jgi:chromosome segregation ATPase
MSKTPRTDDQAVRIMFGMLDTVVPVEFSRQLETELADKDRQLAEARARIDHLERIVDEMTEEQAALCAEDQTIPELVAAKDRLIEQMREIINDYRIEHKAWCNHDPDNAKKCTCGLSEKIKAALAAERGE